VEQASIFTLVIKLTAEMLDNYNGHWCGRRYKNTWQIYHY